MSFKTKLKYTLWGFAIAGLASALYILWFLKFIFIGAVIVYLMYKVHLKCSDMIDWWSSKSLEYRLSWANTEAEIKDKANRLSRVLKKLKFWRKQ